MAQGNHRFKQVARIQVKYHSERHTNLCTKTSKSNITDFLILFHVQMKEKLHFEVKKCTVCMHVWVCPCIVYLNSLNNIRVLEGGQAGRSKGWNRPELLCNLNAAYRACLELTPHTHTHTYFSIALFLRPPFFLSFGCRKWGIRYRLGQQEGRPVMKGIPAYFEPKYPNFSSLTCRVTRAWCSESDRSHRYITKLISPIKHTHI